MRPGPFNYSRPSSVAGVLAAMRAGAVPLAGGQSLLQSMRLRQQAPGALVDLGAAAELSAAIEADSTTVSIGARVTHRALAEHPLINAEFPWLAQAARALGDVQVRNRGTVVGNVCWADPRANMAVAMLATDVRVHCVEAGEAASVIPIDAFFTGFKSNALNGRLAVRLELARRPARRGCYREFSRQRQDLALANVCVVIGGAATRVVAGGVHQTPLRLQSVEAVLAESAPSASRVARAIEHAFDDLTLEPLNDPYGPPAFKQHLAQVELARALVSVLENPQ